MKKYLGLLSVLTFLLIGSSYVSAAPDNVNKAENNPQVVAYYADGYHAIPGEDASHTGVDLVMQCGNSGVFQQWFTGTTTEDGGKTEGDHTVWRSIGSDTNTSSDSTLITNANQSWGDYLNDGNYSATTNDFNSH